MTAQAARPKGRFAAFSRRAARAAGHPAAFLLACATIAIWALLGPVLGFSDTWQLAINTTTTLVTFLMVFVIQSSQNRDSEAMQVKLDELIRVTKGAHNALLDLENLEERDLDKIRAGYARLADKARTQVRRGRRDTGVAALRDGGGEE